MRERHKSQQNVKSRQNVASTFNFTSFRMISNAHFIAGNSSIRFTMNLMDRITEFFPPLNILDTSNTEHIVEWALKAKTSLQER